MFREFPNHDALALSYLDYPWHERRFTHEQERKFLQLTHLHEIAMEWVKTLQLDAALEPLNPKCLLDDTSPEDVLNHLESYVWNIQASTLDILFKGTPPSEKSSLENILEQSTWRLGRRTSEAQRKAFSEMHQSDLRSLIWTTLESPFFPTGPSGFLIKRAVKNEVHLELRSCPHQNVNTAIREVADSLCKIHSQWLRGFIYGYNPRIAMQLTLGNLEEGIRCEHRWHLITHPT